MGSIACCGQDPTSVSTPLGTQGNSNLQKNSIEQLSKAVDSLFRKYDKDQSGYLDKKEVTSIINAALSEINNGKKAKR